MDARIGCGAAPPLMTRVSCAAAPLEDTSVIPALLSLHSLVATLTLIAGGVTLLSGIAAYVIARRAAPAASASSAASAAQAGEATSANTPAALARRVFRWLLAVTAGLGALQAVFGVLLVTQGCQPREGLHYVYGVIVLAAIPVAYVYSDQQQVRRDIIIMTIAAAAVVGAAIRAFATGPGR